VSELSRAEKLFVSMYIVKKTLSFFYAGYRKSDIVLMTHVFKEKSILKEDVN